MARLIWKPAKKGEWKGQQDERMRRGQRYEKGLQNEEMGQRHGEGKSRGTYF